MGLLQRLRITRKIEKRIMSLAEFDKLLDDQINGQPTHAGVDVSETTALNISAFYNAMAIYAGTIASLPLILYERAGDGKKRAMDHPLYSVLHDRANPEMDAFSWRESATLHVFDWGNHYSQRQGRLCYGM